MMAGRYWTVGQADDCDVRVTDPYVSRYHCVVTQTATGDYYVADLGSMNGTRIRRADRSVVKVIGDTQMHPGDTLIIGRVEIPWRPS